MSSSRYIFVSGPARSGTTLLQLVLSAHPDMTITPECSFITKFIDKYYHNSKQLNISDINELIIEMTQDQKLMNWPLFNLSAFKQTLQLCSDIRLKPSKFVDCLFTYYAKRIESGTKWIGNKKGSYAAGYGPLAKKLFPDAKFIYIVRDPRAVVRSMIENLDYIKDFNDAIHACTIRGYFIKVMGRMFPEECFTIRYEDLVKYPDKSIRNLCKFLDITPHENMLKFYKENIRGEKLIAHKKKMFLNTTTPFNRKLIDQWRKFDVLSMQQIGEIEICNRAYMKRYGYTTEYLSYVHPIKGCYLTIMSLLKQLKCMIRGIIIRTRLHFSSQH